jgi:hypothetical protein
MRTTSFLRHIATLYALGAVWGIVMVGVALVSMDAITNLFVTLGIEAPMVVAVSTVALAILAASLVTLALATRVRRPWPTTQLGSPTHA